MLASLVLWADAAKPAMEPTAPWWSGLMPIVLMVVAFFFLVILPGQRREKRMREAIDNALKKNVEVVTSGGIIGVVAHVKEGGDEVTLKIDDNARMRVLRSSIVRVLTPQENQNQTKS